MKIVDRVIDGDDKYEIIAVKTTITMRGTDGRIKVLFEDEVKRNRKKVKTYKLTPDESYPL